VSEVTIRSIATGGDGVGTLPDGMTVFVPRTAPGDVARVDVLERRRRWARGRVHELVRPGPDRIPPTCHHYVEDGCGGCQLQHLSQSAQESAKLAIVRDVLARLGRRGVEKITMVPAPESWRYRTKIALAVVDGRVGFHRFDRPGEVFDLDDCPIAVRSVMDLLRGLRQVPHAIPAEIDQIILRLDRTGGGHVALRGGTRPFDAEPIACVLPHGTTIWWKPEGGAARVVFGAGSVFPALAFQQVNPDFADRIRRDAIAWLDAGSESVVWDLYGGLGDAARALAASGATVWSVDADQSAVDWARIQPVSGPTTPRFLSARVEESLHRLPDPGSVVLNPPREGVHARVTRGLEALAARGCARRVAYVSCDPATLARDLARLPTYALRSVTAYDLFPQTSHVETLACLEAT
jgi:23S rRNA (uracil1939-C5)-methyltransferase